MCDAIHHINIHIMRAQIKEERQEGAKRIFLKGITKK